MCLCEYLNLEVEVNITTLIWERNDNTSEQFSQ